MFSLYVCMYAVCMYDWFLLMVLCIMGSWNSVMDVLCIRTYMCGCNANTSWRQVCVYCTHDTQSPWACERSTHMHVYTFMCNACTYIIYTTSVCGQALMWFHLVLRNSRGNFHTGCCTLDQWRKLVQMAVGLISLVSWLLLSSSSAEAVNRYEEGGEDFFWNSGKDAQLRYVRGEVQLDYMCRWRLLCFSWHTRELPNVAIAIQTERGLKIAVNRPEWAQPPDDWLQSLGSLVLDLFHPILVQYKCTVCTSPCVLQ